MAEVVRVTRAGLGRLSDDDVREVIEDFLLPRLAREPMSPIAGSLLEGVVDEQTHHGAQQVPQQVPALGIDNTGSGYWACLYCGQHAAPRGLTSL